MSDEAVVRAAKIKNTHAQIANALGKLSKLFASRCKLTFLMLDPHDAEAFVFVSDDDISKVIEQLKVAEKKEAQTLTPGDVLAAHLGLEMPK